MEVVGNAAEAARVQLGMNLAHVLTFLSGVPSPFPGTAQFCFREESLAPGMTENSNDMTPHNNIAAMTRSTCQSCRIRLGYLYNMWMQHAGGIQDLPAICGHKPRHYTSKQRLSSETDSTEKGC